MGRHGAMKPAGKACERKGMGEGDLMDQGRSGQCLDIEVVGGIAGLKTADVR